MVTLKQIAQVCGVSVASVSKAINHAPDISQETAEKIRATAKELGYFPNAAARALKTKRTYNIGVLFNDLDHSGLTHEYFVHILNAVKSEAERNGYDITFIGKNIQSGYMGYLDHCRYRNVDGVVIANVDFFDPAVTELVNSEIPVVTIDFTFSGCSAVMSDNLNAMIDLTNYLCDMGHRDLAFIHGETTAVTRLRLSGFYRVLKERGIRVPDEYIIPAKYHNPKLSGQATRQLLSLPKPPSCILYPDDISILGGITEIEKHGLKIPQDISVVGYDAIPLSRVLRPTLTSLWQDTETLGTQAAKLLLQTIDDPKTFVQQIITVPGKIQPGQTVRKL